MTAQEMERKLRSAMSEWADSPSTAGWTAVLDVVYDYAGSEYDAGYANCKREHEVVRSGWPKSMTAQDSDE
jgi:hypothetical protein